ncbi:MAG: hypothetical protein FVQ82_17345, partial [Planctomycetes bacterium]|nr:hypothetical protein [Planctomycetota bacterium]
MKSRKMWFSAMMFLVIFLSANVACLADADFFFEGDLNRDLKINLEDMFIFAGQWLDPSGCLGRDDCADFDGVGGVGVGDFAVIAKRWMMDVSTPIISEFCASNRTLLLDEDDESSDWIEIYNPLNESVDLSGWALTDDKGNADKWLFPEMSIGAGEYLVVFASGRDRSDPAGELHTNFSLSAGGEYLAITLGEGATVLQEFDNYPSQYRDVSYGVSQQGDSSDEGYFLTSTPRSQNGTADAVVGPRITNVSHSPELPADSDDIVVTAEVAKTEFDVNSTNVRLYYRSMYRSEQMVTMVDDGSGDDAVAGDNIYTGSIPSAASSSNEMVRYYITASDVAANNSRLPAYKSEQYSEKYFGTVIDSDSVATQMDMFRWFVEDPAWYTYGPSGHYTKEYASTSVFYKGRFYDNVQTRIRGASSISSRFPKQSMKFEFNNENRFYYSADIDGLNEINVNALSVDKGFIRNHLSMAAYRDAGGPYCASDMWLSYRNGEFHSVVNFVEQVDEQYLKRNGLAKTGALYKIFNYLTDSRDRPEWYPGANPNALDGVEKKTRTWEDNSDMQDFVDGILTPTNRGQYLFDNINVPEVINFMCVNMIHQCWDRFEKNYYMYRDSEGSGEWYILPWDQDLAWGYLTWMNDSLSGSHSSMSHPFYGESEHPSAYGEWNRLDEAMLDNATIRQMYLRRLRTVFDEQFQAPDTPAAELKIENYIDQMIAKIGTEVDADKSKWGVVFGGFRSFEAEMDMIKEDYVAEKRDHFYIAHGPGGTGLFPAAQVGNPQISFGDFDYNPGVGIVDDPEMDFQDCEYIELENNNAYAVDITGWKLTGGVEFTFKAGTVIPAGGNLYVTPNLKAFRMRKVSPTGGETNFVVGGYDGHLSSWGETVDLLAADDALIDSFSYPPDPSDTQRYLRVSEIMYHPKKPEGVTAFEDEDFEYIELKNIGSQTLDIEGVKFVDGIEYCFPTSTTTTVTKLVTKGSNWKYLYDGSDQGTVWRELGFNDSSWGSGLGQLGFGDGDEETNIGPKVDGRRSAYFRHVFTASDVSNIINLSLDLVFDDGVVVYINNQEVKRVDMPEGTIDYDTLATGGSTDNETITITDINPSILNEGLNILGVEVHQVTDNSSDISFDLSLEATITTSTTGLTPLGAGEYLIIAKNPNAFSSVYDTNGIFVAPVSYNGSFSNSGEKIKLEDATGSTILEFDYKDGWYDITDGGGFSLTIRDAGAADLTLWDEKAGWRPSAAAGGSPGVDDTGIIPEIGAVVINEILAHTDISP